MSRRPAASDAMATVHAVAVPVADPDTASIRRERGLRNQLGRMMQGHAGDVVDYDRGDPEHSYTRVLSRTDAPAGLYARVGIADAAILGPPTEIYDVASTDPELTAYQASMLARITR